MSDMVNDVMVIHAGVDVTAVLQQCEEIDRGPRAMPCGDGLKLLDEAGLGSARAGRLGLSIKLFEVVRFGRSKDDRVAMAFRVRGRYLFMLVAGTIIRRAEA